MVLEGSLDLVQKSEKSNEIWNKKICQKLDILPSLPGNLGWKLTKQEPKGNLGNLLTTKEPFGLQICSSIYSAVQTYLSRSSCPRCCSARMKSFRSRLRSWVLSLWTALAGRILFLLHPRRPRSRPPGPRPEKDRCQTDGCHSVCQI